MQAGLRRRRDRGRLGHRRRIPPADAVPRPVVHDPGGPQRHRRARGISSGTRASARPRSCTPSGSRSGRGATRCPWPTARRSRSTSRTQPPSSGSTCTSSSTARWVGADFDTRSATWTVTLAEGRTVTANFLYFVRGLLRLRRGLPPGLRGRRRLPRNNRPPAVLARRPRLPEQARVVIGSGATAVTLIPAMAPDAAHITMLQRSPT